MGQAFLLPLPQVYLSNDLETREAGQRSGISPACILAGRNYDKVVKDLQLFSHSFSQINTWIHFLFSSLRAYCFVSAAASHSRVPELSGAPPMGVGYQQERRSSL